MSKIKQYGLGLVYILGMGIASSAVMVVGFVAIIAILAFMFWSLPLHSPLPMIVIILRLGFVLGIGFGICTVSGFLRGYGRTAVK